MALGTHSLGVHDYYVCLFTHLGICVTPDVRHYLMKQQQARARRIVTHKKKEVKLRRIEKLHKKLKEHTEELQCIICKKEGSVYQPGIGVDAGICLPTSDVATKASLKACSSCNQIGTGHVRPWSEKCSNYKEYMLSCSKKPVTGTEVDTVSVSEQEALLMFPLWKTQCTRMPKNKVYYIKLCSTRMLTIFSMHLKMRLSMLTHQMPSLPMTCSLAFCNAWLSRCNKK